MWSVFRSLFGKKPEDGRKILPAGDCALVVEFGNEINEALNRKVQCLNEKVAAAHGCRGAYGFPRGIKEYHALLAFLRL